jgi:hypothetical protein
MTRKIRKKSVILFWVAAVFSAILLPLAASAENLRFVFLADSRSDTHGDPPSPEAMINTAVLNPIINQIKNLNPKPAFVVFGGDGAYRGYYHDDNVTFYTFQTFKDLFAPLTSAGIKLYTAIGNHELYDQHGGTFKLANQTEYQQVFSDNPGNGPAGYERLVYSFTSPGGSAFFATLDPYYITADTPATCLDGDIDDTQLNWLAAQVAQTRATHKFLFIHTPYYYVSAGDPEEPSCGVPVSFTKLWTILDNHNFDFFACGHSHLYSRKIVDRTVAPKPQTDPPRPPWKNRVVQLLNGTCGAPVDTSASTKDASWHVHNQAGVYYFSVVDIHNALLIVTTYAYDANTATFSVIDSFSIFKGGQTGPNLLLLGNGRDLPRKE